MTSHLTIITGASAGIGAALAPIAHEAGHHVATVSRRPGPGTHLAADLSDPESWPVVSSWMDDLMGSQQWDRTTLIHNAGTLDPIGFAGEVDTSSYTSNILLNAAAPQVLGNAYVASATAHGLSAMLLLVSSGAGSTPYPGWSSYCAAKSAVNMWAAAVGLEQDERSGNVSVLSFAPGVVATDMQAKIREQSEAEFPNVERFRTMHGEGALASPDAVARQLFDLSLQQADGRIYRSATLTNGALIDIRSLDEAAT